MSMNARITLWEDGEEVVHTGPTIPDLITRVWGERAELHRGQGEAGTYQIIERTTRRSSDWHVLAQVELVEYATTNADRDSLRGAQARLGKIREDRERLLAERDEIVLALWERGETIYAIAQVMGVTEAAARKIVWAGRDALATD